jgi:hypothetical protein
LKVRRALVVQLDLRVSFKSNPIALSEAILLNPGKDLSQPGLAPLMQALTTEGAPNALAMLQTKPADPLSKRERFCDVGSDESRQRADWDEAISECDGLDAQVVRGGIWHGW